MRDAVDAREVAGTCLYAKITLDLLRKCYQSLIR